MRKEIFFNPCRKVFDLRFCPIVYHCDLRPIGSRVSVTQRKVLSRIKGGRHLVIWFRERNSSSTLQKCTRIILF